MKGGHRGGRILTFQPIYPENPRRGSSRATIRFVDLINFVEARNWRGWTLCNRACPPSLCASPLGKIFFLFLSLFFSVSRVIFTILTLVEIREFRGLRSDNFVLSEETRPVSIHHAYRDEGVERMGRRENIYARLFARVTSCTWMLRVFH